MRRRQNDVRSEERKALQMRTARQGIMLAAARIVAESGYQATTMRTIAREAGYTASSLYTYFKSKDEIFTALQDELMAHHEVVVSDEIPEGLGFEARVSLLTQRLRRFVEEYQEAVALHILGGPGMPHEDRDHRIARMRSINRRLVAWFETHATPEELGGHEPVVVASLYRGVLEGLTEQAFVDAGGAFDMEGMRACHARVVSFFMAALAAPPR